MSDMLTKVRNDGTTDHSPSAPGAITPTTTERGVTLLWKPAQDDHAIKGYRIYRDGKAIATVRNSTWFVDAQAKEAHNYEVRAIDSAGLVGAASKLPLKTMLKQDAASTAQPSPAAPAQPGSTAPTQPGSPAPTQPGSAAPTAPAAAGNAPTYSDMKPTGADSFRLEWKPVPGAVAYGVYQDGKLLGHVKNPSFAASITNPSASIQIDAVLQGGARSEPAPAVTLAKSDKGIRIAALNGVPVEKIAQAMQERQAAAGAASAPAPAATPPAAAAAPTPAAATTPAA